MFAIRSGAVCVGSVRSADQGSDWYNVNRGWTPARDEATVFDSRDEAEQVLAAESLANAAVVVDMDADTTMRADGLNNPLSPNGATGCTWAAVEDYCEESDAVESYDRSGNSLTITWADGNADTFIDPQSALTAITAAG